VSQNPFPLLVVIVPPPMSTYPFVFTWKSWSAWVLRAIRRFRGARRMDFPRFYHFTPPSFKKNVVSFNYLDLFYIRIYYFCHGGTFSDNFLTIPRVNNLNSDTFYFSMVYLSILQGFLLGPLSIIIPKASTIWLRNSSDPIGCHDRTASYPTAPAQIPACGTTARGSSEILASVAKTTSPSALIFIYEAV